MSPLTKNPYTFHRYPNSANRNIKKAIKAIKILTFYQQRRTPWYHVCEKQQRANSGQGWHFCHAQWTSNGYSYFRSSLTTSAFLYLKLLIDSALALFNLLKVFKNLSGLVINSSKTEGIWIGSSWDKTSKPFGIKWPDEPIKALGVYYSYDIKLLHEKNLLRD